MLGQLSTENPRQSLLLLNSQLPAMEAVAHCINQGWPVLLAGGQGRGKKPPGSRQDVLKSDGTAYPAKPEGVPAYKQFKILNAASLVAALPILRIRHAQCEGSEGSSLLLGCSISLRL